jgi:Tfp pilus assembly protein PilN
MIRINLLGVAKPVAHVAGPSEGMAPEAIFIPGALFVILGLSTLFVWWYWTNQINTLQKTFVAQQKERDRLKGIAEQNQRYLARKTQLEYQKKVIDTLNENRVGPAHLMRSLGVIADRSNDLYLVSVSSKENHLAVDGLANSTDAIANFISALEQSGTFSEVQLHQSFEDDQGKRVSFKFNLDCTYNQNAGAASTTPAAQRGAMPAAAKQAGM